mmetsp:Transcript_1836/g.3822  ORF Transcript_1836/g.3822 Transcript_1836/m.3822 type:complete len:274 (+) Transcript_1836:3091-3912(+)
MQGACALRPALREAAARHLPRPPRHWPALRVKRNEVFSRALNAARQARPPPCARRGNRFATPHSPSKGARGWVLPPCGRPAAHPTGGGFRRRSRKARRVGCRSSAAGTTAPRAIPTTRDPRGTGASPTWTPPRTSCHPSTPRCTSLFWQCRSTRAFSRRTAGSPSGREQGIGTTGTVPSAGACRREPRRWRKCALTPRTGCSPSWRASRATRRRRRPRSPHPPTSPPLCTPPSATRVPARAPTGLCTRPSSPSGPPRAGSTSQTPSRRRCLFP